MGTFSLGLFSFLKKLQGFVQNSGKNPSKLKCHENLMQKFTCQKV